MKWKLTILALLAALLLGLCLWWHLYRQNTKVVYETKIEKDSGFKATFDKKKGTLTISSGSARSSNGIRSGKDSKRDEKNGDEQGTSNTVSVPRRATIDYDEHTRVLKVFAPKSGFVFEPGLSGMLGYKSTDGNKLGLRLGLDVCWGFYKRWGIVTGVSGTTGQRISPAVYIGATWQPSEEYFTNTSLLLGIDNRKDWYLGIRIGL